MSEVIKKLAATRGSDPVLRIVLWAGGMPFDGRTIETESLGGSESAAYYMAEQLRVRGHEVIVFTTHANPQPSPSGVTYHPCGAFSEAHQMGDRFEQYAINTPHDVLVIQRLPGAFIKPFAAKICVWQLHDLALFRTAGQMLGQMWQVDLVTVVSEWHAEQVKKVWNINPKILRVVRNGVDRALYGKANTANAPDIPPAPLRILYQSRPERGLVHLLRPGGIMDRLRDTGIELVRCTYKNEVSHMAEFYNQLDNFCLNLPNVRTLEPMSKPELAKLQQQCDALVYPTEFEEVSCITAMEAANANLPLLTTTAGALPETCEGGGVILLPMTADGKVDEDAFVAKLTEWAESKAYPKELQELRVKQAEKAPEYDWSAAAESLLDGISEAFDRRQSSEGAVLRHAIEHSDIGFAKWFVDNVFDDYANAPDRLCWTAISELEDMYAFTESDEAYAAHYKVHQTAYYDEFEDKVIGEDVTATTRFRGVLAQMSDALKRNWERGEAQGLRVLDYGCAHGHYTMALAKFFPMVEFVGVDISERAVAAAKKWAERDGVTNVSFLQGSQANLTDPEDNLGLGIFDIVLAGEVVEHVWDYLGLLEALRSHLEPDGALIVTTPTGRWEHSGTEAFRKAREHLHHFERGDILDITAGHECKILHAPAGADKSNFPLGSYVWTVWPRPDIPLWKVDYARKLTQYAPRQSISACLIVKDGKNTIERALESIVDWVDEIVVCVDPASKDETMARVANLSLRYPLRAWQVVSAEKSALRDGFDEARNESIGYATGDWILWMDADEEVREPWALHRLARPSMHGGYGFPQVHYSVQPAQVLTTDYPCRFFRNHEGVRFYGVVHEHPEHEMGKAVLWSLVRHEITFLHHGYADEETRKKRFERNYPLLLRDLEKYPENRPLNQFLHLRDIAQSIVFESQRFGGAVLDHHIEAAQRGVALMEKIALAESTQIRMISDAMQYYSFCVITLGKGFDAEIDVKVSKPEAPALSCTLNVKGKFHSREFFGKLINRFAQESTKQYEDRYL